MPLVGARDDAVVVVTVFESVGLEGSAQARVRELLERRFIFVVGKGGTGKSTVSAALGAAAVASGRNAVVCDVTGDAGAGGAETERSPDRLTIDPDDALLEWIRRQPGGAVAASVLRRAAIFKELMAAAPGVREVVTLGKAADLVRGPSVQRDLAIVDGPATGHGLAMLRAPATIGAIARAGPVADQARALRDFLADPSTSGYVGVALPEEMAVRETVELDQGLDAALGRGLDVIVVNAVLPDRFTDEEAEQLDAARRRAGDQGVLEMVLAAHRRARKQAQHVAWLRSRSDAPVLTLPFVFSGRLGADAHAELGGRLVGR